jgi:hypothetical protein
LLPILSGIGGQGGINAAKDSISNAIASVKGGGTITSQNFEIKRGDTLTSKMLSDKGFL